MKKKVDKVRRFVNAGYCGSLASSGSVRGVKDAAMKLHIKLK